MLPTRLLSCAEGKSRPAIGRILHCIEGRYQWEGAKSGLQSHLPAASPTSAAAIRKTLGLGAMTHQLGRLRPGLAAALRQQRLFEKVRPAIPTDCSSQIGTLDFAADLLSA